MTLLKTSALNGVAVLTRVGTALLLNKILAVYVGPAGYAVIGQFQSLVGMVTGLASGAVGTGVTKYTAEYHAQPERQLSVWRTAVVMGSCGSIVGALLLLLAREPLAAWLLADRTLGSVFVWLAFALTLMVANGLMLAILNGKKAIGAFVSANIAGSLINAAAAVILVLSHGLYGALVALCIGQALAAGATAWLFQRACATPWRTLWGGFDTVIARRLAGFALMAVVSGIVVPTSHMIIRDHLAGTLGWHTAGLWQALWKISDLHLMLLTSTLVAYFLPRFSELPAGPQLRREVLRAYRFVVPLVITTAVAIFLLRVPLVRGMLTAEFLPLTEALGWQLVGDGIKVCSWVAGYTMISHARVALFISTEIVFTLLLVGTTLVGAAIDGLRGTSIAYAATYAAYGALMFALLMQFTHRPAAPSGDHR
jgi:PST family polysaccharide transporter